MKHVCITYHMHRAYPKKETAETCITPPMTKEIADDIVEKGAESKYLAPRTVADNLRVVPGGVIYEALCCLSEMQGYRYDSFCTSEEVYLTDAGEIPVKERFLVRNVDGSRKNLTCNLAELTLDELQAIRIEATHILKCREAGKASMANGHYSSPFRICDVVEEAEDQLMVHMYDNQLEGLLSVVKTVMKHGWGIE